MLSFVNKYAKNYFASQNGEEGLLFEIIRRLGIENGSSVELGGSNGLFCSNTALLLREHGWRGLFVEYDYTLYLECKRNYADFPNVRSQCSRVDEDNINAFVDDSCDLLSLDTDGSDWKIFKGLKARPKIVIVEIDSSIPPDRNEFNSGGGAGYLPMITLGYQKGYFLLCHTGNLVFIAEEYEHLFPEINESPFTESEYFFNRSWLKEEAA